MRKSSSIRHVAAPIMYLAVGAAIAALVWSFVFASDAAFRSSEVAFADPSQSGLNIVPASCPSSPHYAGECGGGSCVAYAGQVCTSGANRCGMTNSGTYSCEGVCTATRPSDSLCPTCTPRYYCAGSQLYYQSYQCTTSLVQSCTYGCSGSACLPPPSITFVPFTAQNPLGSFQASGHLQAKPQLVRKGEFSYLYWNATNVTSCSVTGTNGDHWTGKFSGESGKKTKAITGQVIYTLNCTGLPGATPASITESVTVNIVPDFNEL